MPGPISEDDFKAKVYLTYRVHFDQVIRLHRVAEGAMLSYRNQTVTAYEASLSLIFPRAFKSYDSIRSRERVILLRNPYISGRQIDGRAGFTLAIVAGAKVRIGGLIVG